MFSLILCSLFGLHVHGLSAVAKPPQNSVAKMLCHNPAGDWQLVLTVAGLSQLFPPPPARVTPLRLWPGVSSGLPTLPLPGILFIHAFLGWVGFCFLLCLWCSEINLRPHACIRQTFYLWAKFAAPHPQPQDFEIWQQEGNGKSCKTS